MMDLARQLGEPLLDIGIGQPLDFPIADLPEFRAFGDTQAAFVNRTISAGTRARLSVLV